MRIVYFFLSDFCVDFCPILCTIFVCFFLFNFLCDFCKLYIVLMHELIFFLIGLSLYIYETENIGERVSFYRGELRWKVSCSSGLMEVFLELPNSFRIQWREDEWVLYYQFADPGEGLSTFFR